MTLPHADLDAIVALQLTVAWAGERAAEPERLGWWETDLVDELAGGDLFARLLPRTAAWAGLELAREAARRADRRARAQLADPDAMATLFHFGFALDEALDDRLAHLKRTGAAPSDALGEHFGVRPEGDPEPVRVEIAEADEGTGPAVEACRGVLDRLSRA